MISLVEVWINEKWFTPTPSQTKSLGVGALYYQTQSIYAPTHSQTKSHDVGALYSQTHSFYALTH